jgi:acid phosphatase type 7
MHIKTYSTWIGCLAIALGAGCQNTSNTGGSGGHATGAGGNGGAGPGSGGGANIQSFKPEGCGFSIAPRMEYTGYEKAAPTVKGDPHIRRVRLGLGGNVDVTASNRADPSTSIAMAWQTDEGTLASDVAWGTDPDPSKWSSSDRTSGVTWDTPPGGLNAMGPERMHEVYVCGLEPATTYYYRVGGGPSSGEVWSDVYSFATTPAGGDAATVKIALTGDSRGEQHNAWQLLESRVRAAGVTLQMFSGDMINLAPDQGEWEEWLTNGWQDGKGNPSALPEILTLSAHGNHDNHTSLFYGNLVLPQDLQAFPKYTELFFSFDVGPVHIVVMDDAWIVDQSGAGDPQYHGTLHNWLDADLTKANQNRSKVPWIITMHHHPAYSSSDHGMDADVLTGRAFYEPIWEQYHVDIDFAGHDHDYERSKPLTGPVDSPTSHTDPKDGTIYVVCAGSGADPYSAGNSSFTELSHDFTGGGAIGLYSYLTATAATLSLEAHELRADGSDPMFDTLTITK